MTEREVLQIFQDEKALLNGHFLLSSGLHSGQYMQCALVLQKPWIAEKLCAALAAKVKEKVDVVIGPALGGVFVAHETARALKTRSIFAERVDGTLVLRRGFSLNKGEKVLVVEDVVTTGKSTNEVLDIVRQSGAQTVAVASVVDRTGGKPAFKEPFYALVKVDIQTYKPEECPLCREAKIPVSKPGSRTSA